MASYYTGSSLNIHSHKWTALVVVVVYHDTRAVIKSRGRGFPQAIMNVAADTFVEE